MANGTVTATLEKNSYVASPADIEALVKEQLNAATTSVKNRTTYLRALIATTQDKLGLTVRSRGAPAKLSPEGVKEQLAALESVHEGFYSAVQKAIDESPLSDEEKPKTGRTSAAAIKARRATFARSAMSTVRSWIRAGRDLASIAVTKVTKAAIAIQSGQSRRRAISPKRLITRAEKQSKALIGTLLALTEIDRDAGQKEFQTTMNILSDQLVTMGMVATRDAAQAVAEHRPLRIKGTVFVPTATQVMRQQARPS